MTDNFVLISCCRTWLKIALVTLLGVGNRKCVGFLPAWVIHLLQSGLSVYCCTQRIMSTELGIRPIRFLHTLGVVQKWHFQKAGCDYRGKFEFTLQYQIKVPHITKVPQPQICFAVLLVVLYWNNIYVVLQF